jgi:hypothetical protein
VVESTGLENRRTRKGIVSSNLTLSACGTTTYGTGSAPDCSGALCFWEGSGKVGERRAPKFNRSLNVALHDYRLFLLRND